jgi:hypothetical protein
MTMSLNRYLSSVLVLFVAASAVRGADLEVIRLTSQPVDDPWSQSQPDVLTSRGVLVDADALRQTAPAVGARFVVPLGDGIELTAVVQERELLSESRFTVVGQLDDHPASSFLLVGNGTALVGSFRSIEHGTYTLRLTPRGEQVLRRKDPSAPGGSCGVGSPSLSSTAVSQGASDPPPQAVTSADTGEWVDILIGYTPPAAALVIFSGFPVVEDHAVAAILDMNIRLNNSEVLQPLPKIRRRGEVFLSQTASGDSNDDLADLKGASDGLWDEIHDLRSFHGADLVHVFVANLTSNLAGLAYRPESSSELTVDMSYGLSRWDHAESGVFAHELGHNFGCHHHPDDFDAACQTCPPAGQDPVVQPWAFGHREPGDPNIRTTMAYPASGYELWPYFSTPDLVIIGTGLLGEEGERDNTRLIAETGDILAQYTPSVTFVQESAPLYAETGSLTFPYKTLEDGIIASVPGHEVKLIEDDDFTGSIPLAVQLSSAYGNAIVIGQQ